MGNKIIESKKDKIFVGVLIALAVILIALTVVFFIQRAENKRHVNEITVEKNNLKTELQDLSLEYQNLQTDNDTLKGKLADEQEKINQLIEKMRIFRDNSYSEISKYKKEVTTLKTVLRSYIVQIDSLNRLNEALLAENKQVKKQMNWAKERASELEKKTEKMQVTISKAATLEAIDFTVYPVNKKDRKIQKYSKAKKLKAEFKLRKNITAKRGTRSLYLRIQGPDESVLVSKTQGTFKHKGSKIIYTATRDIEFEGDELEVAIYWDNDGSLAKGKYTADLFSKENHIGTTTFYLK